MSLDILATTSSRFGFQDIYARLTSEEDKFRCPVKGCGREFTSKRNLVDHSRGHHQGAKPHTCTYAGCGKSFLRPAHLLIHTRIHTGEKPFVCEYEGCGKRWNQKSALKQHLRSHTGEKPFSCTFEGCGKRFSTSSSCKRHVLTHGKPEHSGTSTAVCGHKRQLSIDSWDVHPNTKKWVTTASCEGKEERVAEPLIKTEIRMTFNFILN